MKCEHCLLEMNHVYGSGRFCSRKCASAHSSKINREERNKKISLKLKGRQSAQNAASWSEEQRKIATEKSKATWAKKWIEISVPRLELDKDLGRLGGRSKMKAIIIEKKSGKCQHCGISEWNGKKIVLHIHHIDGDVNNNKFSNFEVLCPNCHSQTDNFCAKNSKSRKVSDAELRSALEDPKNKTIAEALRSVGLADKGRNYQRAYKIQLSLTN